ncbi:MAG: hypothetical protein U5L72_17360 [Bacteroidales bacterium]|nr:hypothetical protein [Bacteroidales bacterium]
MKKFAPISAILFFILYFWANNFMPDPDIGIGIYPAVAANPVAETNIVDEAILEPDKWRQRLRRRLRHPQVQALCQKRLYPQKKRLPRDTAVLTTLSWQASVTSARLKRTN